MRILLSLLIFGFLTSCSKDDNDYINVRGRIISEITNEGVENAPISVYSEEYYEEWSGGYLSIGNNSGFTDNNGNFSISVKFSNKGNYFTFYSGDEFNITDILGRNDRFTFEKATSGDLIFKVRRKGKLKIILKNTNPFDEYDSVSFSVYQGLGYNPKVYEINNYGVENVFIANYPMNTHWIGMNVDSTIFSTLEEGRKYKLYVHVTKNGVETDYFTPEFETDLINLNEYVLNY